MPGSKDLAALPQGGRLSFWAKMAFCVGLWPLILVLSDPVWRLGLPAAWDEVAVYDHLYAALHGTIPPFGLFRGGAHLYLLLPFASWGRPGFLHLPVVLGMALEIYLLWRLARQRAGEPAAFFAVLIHSISRLTLLRLKLTVALSLAPLWILLGWSAALWPGAAPLGLLAALVAGAMALDYEASAVMLPGLAFILGRRWRQGERRESGRLGLALLAGLILRGIPGIHFSWHDYWAVRSQGMPSDSAFLGGFVDNVGGFFGIGPKPMLDYGPGAISVLVLLFIPFGTVAMGLDGAILLGLGLAILAAPTPGHFEAHRAAAAWAPLCLGAGAGVAEIGKGLAVRWRPALAWGLLFLVFLAWTAIDRANFLRGQELRESNGYDYAWRLWRVDQKVNRALGEGRCSELIDGVSFRPGGARRLFGQTPALDPLAPPWVLLTGEQAGFHPWVGGRWIKIQNDPWLGNHWLLQPDHPDLWRARQDRIQGLLKDWQNYSWQEELGMIEAHLRKGEPDTFVRFVLLDRILWAAKDVHLSRDLVVLIMGYPDLTFAQCVGLSRSMEKSDPALSMILMERALAMDSTRSGARSLRREIRNSMKLQ